MNIFSNTNFKEMMNILENHDDSTVREIAQRFIDEEVMPIEEAEAEGMTQNDDINNIVKNAASYVTDVVKYLLTEAEWLDFSERYKGIFQQAYILNGFNEDTHPFHQNILLTKIDGERWELTVNCGYNYSPKTDCWHGEHCIETTITAKNVVRAKKQAIKFLVDEVASKNLLYLWN